MTSRIVIIKKIFLSVGYCPPYGGLSSAKFCACCPSWNF